MAKVKAYNFKSLRRNLATAMEKETERLNDESDEYPAEVRRAMEAIVDMDDRDPAIQKFKAELERRKAMWDRAVVDPEYQEEVKKLLKDDVVTFVADWIWSPDPRLRPICRPFTPGEQQKKYLLWREECRQKETGGCIEKSRDSGATVLNCAFHLHKMIFEPDYVGTFASRKVELVDKRGDPDSIFEKLRYQLRCLPRWLRPKTKDKELQLSNYDNGSTVKGEGGPNVGRGGRASILDYDEFSVAAEQEKVEAAISENSNCIFYTATPNGVGELFYQKVHGGEWPVFRLHWMDDERKNAWMLKNEHGVVIEQGQGRGAPQGAIYPWYEGKKRKLDKVVLAQEIDIDYTASLKGALIEAKWIQAAIELNLTPNLGEKKVGGLDIADGGADDSVFTIFQCPHVLHIDSWSLDVTQSIFKARAEASLQGIDHLNFDASGLGTNMSGTLRISNMPWTYTPVLGGVPASDRLFEEFGENRKGPDIFLNVRAEIFWLLRERFRKTWEHVNGVKPYHEHELISIPNHQKLITQLSSVLVTYSDDGKIKIESKQEMAKRGVKSPDHADSLAYATARFWDDLSWLDAQ